MTMTDSYETLSKCRLVVHGAPGHHQPPIKLPQECIETAQHFQLPPLYDFAAEKEVLQEQKKRKLLLAAERKSGNRPKIVKSYRDFVDVWSKLSIQLCSTGCCSKLNCVH